MSVNDNYYQLRQLHIVRLAYNIGTDKIIGKQGIRMTVLQGKIGETYVVEELSLAHESGMRLQALGLTAGTKLTILNNKRSGAVIFKVRGTRLAVGKEIASAIAIKEEQ